MVIRAPELRPIPKQETPRVSGRAEQHRPRFQRWRRRGVETAEAGIAARIPQREALEALARLGRGSALKALVERKTEIIIAARQGIISGKDARSQLSSIEHKITIAEKHATALDQRISKDERAESSLENKARGLDHEKAIIRWETGSAEEIKSKVEKIETRLKETDITDEEKKQLEEARDDLNLKVERLSAIDEERTALRIDLPDQAVAMVEQLTGQKLEGENAENPYGALQDFLEPLALNPTKLNEVIANWKKLGFFTDQAAEKDFREIMNPVEGNDKRSMAKNISIIALLAMVGTVYAAARLHKQSQYQGHGQY